MRASGDSAPEAETGARQEVPAGSPLARIQEGMTDVDVRTKLGPPSLERSHRTGKSWIPFYFGSDTIRFEWWYQGQGVVVFNRNAWTGTKRVREIIYDPNALEDGGG
ncbi:MAG: hypothetical protein CL910_10060 [Deltaproteobacteria bacterium]|nr:hypothetical protein [Deltaproteobacteria bacterium]